ncbi:MAG: hypothetical protein IKK93_07280 [Campylobacter sp.]|nr:hypothetical protein [Campylobacter sp.]
MDKKNLGVDSFTKKDATDNPKRIIKNYINRAKGSADVADAREYIALVASEGNHDFNELYDFFVKQMQMWGRTPRKRR